jgi:hypothetical protein
MTGSVGNPLEMRESESRTHRLLHEDGGLHCYSCGAYVANPRGDEYDLTTTRADDDAMRTTASAVPCTGPTTEHPPYVMGLAADGAPIIETCAAHPYSCAAY